MIIITALEDHFTIIYNFQDDQIIAPLERLNKIIKHLEKKAETFAFHNEFGYLTVNPEHTGYGCEISYDLQLTHFFSNEEAKSSQYYIQNQKEEITTLRLQKVHTNNIKAYFEKVCSVVNKEKDQIFDKTLSNRLYGLYPESIVSNLRNTQSFNILDLISKDFKLRACNKICYLELKDCYIEYLEHELSGKLKLLPQQQIKSYDFKPITNKDSDIAFVKMEIGRNFETYPFSRLLTESQKNELYDYVKATFETLSINGNLFEFYQVYNIGTNLRSMYHSDFKISDEDKIFIPVSRAFSCWIGQLDHIRLVGVVPISESDAALKEIKRITDAFESGGKLFLHDEKLGYLTERVELCGLGLSIELKILTSKENQNRYLEYFSKNKRWIAKCSENLEDLTNILTICSQGPYLIDDLFEDLKGVCNLIEELQRIPTNNEN